MHECKPGRAAHGTRRGREDHGNLFGRVVVLAGDGDARDIRNVGIAVG